jgi:hypothetical protein
MNYPGRLFGSNEFHAHCFGPLRQMAAYPLAVVFLVAILALIRNVKCLTAANDDSVTAPGQ